MRWNLKDAYPETPASFDARMRRTLAALPARRKRPSLRSAAALVLAVALALGGLAYAASQSPLLSRLFGALAPTPQAENLLVQSGAETEKDGVTLRIDEYLFDGADLYVRWTVSSARSDELMLVTSDLETGMDAEPILDDCPTEWSLGMGALIGPEHPSISSVSRLHFESQPSEDSFAVSFTAALLTPIAPIVDQDDVSDFSDSPTLLRSECDGLSLLSAASRLQTNGSYFEYFSDDLYAVDDTFTFDGMLKALESCGYAAEVVRIPVELCISPDSSRIVHTTIAGNRIFPFDRFTLIVDAADFTAAGVTIRYRLLPRDSRNPWNSFAANLWFDVLPEGKASDNAFIQSKGDSGRQLSGEIIARAGSSIPRWVRLVPYDDDTGQTFMQYAVDLQLTAVGG